MVLRNINVMNDNKHLLEASADDLERAKLILYKNVASKIEMKKVYFHCQLSAQQTTISPLFIGSELRNNSYTTELPPLPPTVSDVTNVNPYYTPIGTQRKIMLNSEQLRLITGYNISEDRYRIQLSLEEGILVQDTENWTNIRNFAIVDETEENPKLITRTYDVVNEFAPTPQSGTDAGAEQSVSSVYFKEAFKTVQPQPLFIRLDEYATQSNPYQFILQPSGNVTTLEGSQSIIIDDFNKVPQLTLTLGHFLYKGFDAEYQNVLRNNLRFADYTREAESIDSKVRINQSMTEYRDFVFLDPNLDWYNNPSVPTSLNNNIGNKYIDPLSNQPYFKVEKGEIVPDLLPPESEEVVYLANKPLFSNQQYSRILLKFSLTFMPLF